ncbi:MAG: hypothetical protein CL940_08875 [Deltaproteobacteria bacterium]|nr:hypothetical protein [Deltaproteobacteria bacterium]
MRHAQLCSTLLLALLFAACGEESDNAPAPSAPDTVTDTSGADTIAADATEDTVETTGCPAGQILAADSSCTTVGIPGCAEVFMSPESGFCEPRIGLCDAGHYPDFETGCVQAGITECAAEFVDPESGLCVPDPDACGAGAIPVPTQGCVSLDPPEGCGSGTWGTIVEADDDQHVDQAYGGGDSDGSRDAPWTQISQAQANLPSGGRIILAAGDYNETIFLQESVSIVGRCSSMVTVSGATQSPLAANLGTTVLEVAGGVEVSFHDLRVSGDGIGLAAYLGAQVDLERVIFEDNEWFGVFVSGDGTVVTATELLVKGTRPRPGPAGNRGVSAQDGGTMHMERALLTGNARTNALCGGSIPNTLSAMTLKDVVLTQVTPAEPGATTEDLFVNHGSTVSVENTVVLHHGVIGIIVDDPGTSVALDGLVVIGPEASDATVSESINVQGGASVSLHQAAIHRGRDTGLYITDEGTSVQAEGLYINETQPTAQISSGMGILAREGATLNLEGGALIRNFEAGLIARGFATADVAGLLVEGTQATTTGEKGSGIDAFNGAEVTIERSALMENTLVSLLAILQPSVIEIRDSVIAHTLRDAVEFWGRGVQVQAGATLIVERCAIIDNYEAAIFMWEAIGEIRDTLLSDTKVNGEEQIGDGLLVTLSEVIAEGISATRNGRVGVLFDRTEGTISGCSITDNAFGLATQGEDVPEVSEDNAVMGNVNDVVKNSELPIPDEQMVLPEDSPGNS